MPNSKSLPMSPQIIQCFTKKFKFLGSNCRALKNVQNDVEFALIFLEWNAENAVLNFCVGVCVGEQST